tara:strand:- start:1834 stop:2127 length:294 start_codon:yes stop_codon:yes gene_type:complete
MSLIFYYYNKGSNNLDRGKLMSNIIETSFGTLISPERMANGSASNIEKVGAFYNFSIKISNDDIREYSFTNFEKAEYMRRVMIGHLKVKIEKDRATI